MTAMPTADDSASGGPTLDVAWNGKEILLTHLWSDACTPSGCAPHEQMFGYDPVADAWRALPLPATGESFVYTDGVALDGKWILMGGGPGSAPPGGVAGALFDPTASTWSTIPAPPLSPRTLGAVVAATTTHEVIVWGGFLESSSATTEYNDGAAYSLSKGTWRTIAPAPIPGGARGVVSWDGTRMIIVYPTTVADSTIPKPVAAAYDPSTDTWQTLPLPAVAARVNTTFTTVARSSSTRVATAMWGGFPAVTDGDLPALRDGAWFDSDTGTWTTIPDPGMTLVPTDRAWMTSFGANGRFYVWGGEESSPDRTSQTPVATGMVFDLASATWSSMPTAGAPSPRLRAIAVWTGCDAVVFGGDSTAGRGLDGARFRP